MNTQNRSLTPTMLATDTNSTLVRLVENQITELLVEKTKNELKVLDAEQSCGNIEVDKQFQEEAQKAKNTLQYIERKLIVRKAKLEELKTLCN